MLMNLFMHYAYDAWMQRSHPRCPFARYADDRMGATGGPLGGGTLAFPVSVGVIALAIAIGPTVPAIAGSLRHGDRVLSEGSRIGPCPLHRPPPGTQHWS